MNQMLPQVLTDGDIRRRSEIFSILDEIGEDLDLTETQFVRARQSYGAVGDWLSASTDPLLASVLVYLQGSTALGTAVKPVGRREFDVDLICFCAGVASAISPAALKAAVGSRLKEHATYARLLEEKKVTTRLAPPAGFRRKALRHVHSDVVCDVSYARRGDAGRSSWY